MALDFEGVWNRVRIIILREGIFISHNLTFLYYKFGSCRLVLFESNVLSRWSFLNTDQVMFWAIEKSDAGKKYCA